MRIYAREVGFHAAQSPVYSFVPADAAQTSWYASPARHNTLLKCLEATTDYLDCFLSLSSATILNLATPDFLRLLYAVLILGRFYTGVDAPLLDATLLRTKSNLGYYLDALAQKLGNVLADLHNPRDHHLVYLRSMFEDSKKWYGSAIAGKTAIHEDLFSATPLQLTEKVHSTDTEICVDIPDGRENCPEFFEPSREKAKNTPDPVDLFINWEDFT